eukprot:scaffold103145_cov19-Tisochrysis_lutea.AAC.1
MEARLRKEREEMERRQHKKDKDMLEELERRMAQLRLDFMRSAEPRPPWRDDRDRGPRRDGPGGPLRPGGRMNAVYLPKSDYGPYQEDMEQLEEELEEAAGTRPVYSESAPPPAYAGSTTTDYSRAAPRQVRFADEEESVNGPFGTPARVGASSPWANRAPMPMEWAASQQQQQQQGGGGRQPAPRAAPAPPMGDQR